MNKKLVRYMFILSSFAFFLMIPLNLHALADENDIEKQGLKYEKSSITDVIIPEAIEGNYVKKMPTYNSSNLGSYNNKKSLISTIMNKNKAFKNIVTFTSTIDPDTLIDAYENALYQAGNDYVLGTLSEYSYSYKYSNTSKTYTYTMEFEYIATVKQENYVTKKVKAIATSLTKKGMTDLEKVVAVNDYVVSHTVYSTKTKTSPHHIYAHLTEGKAVCQAYALLTYRLLKEMGIEARYVVGTAGDGDHAWNSVKINGVWYHLDTTWNDSSFNNADTLSNIGYSYFLVTSTTLSKDHSWNKSIYPKATDKRYSYFHNINKGILHKGEIYYSAKNSLYLYKLNIKTGKSKLLLKHRVYYLEAYNNIIYFSDYSNGGYLTSYNLSTGKTKIIDKSNVSQLQVVNGYLKYKKNGKIQSYLLPKSTTKKLSAINPKNVTITNNIGNDKIVFKNLTKGYTYTVYSDSKLKKKLFTFTASKTTYSKTLKQIGAKAGAVYVDVSKSGYTKSETTKVTFKAQPTASIASKNVKITNAKSKDTIKLTSLRKGTTYVIYQDNKKKKKISTFKADKTTKTITVKQLGINAGKIYITAHTPGYRVSALTAVSYTKQK